MKRQLLFMAVGALLCACGSSEDATSTTSTGGGGGTGGQGASGGQGGSGASTPVCLSQHADTTGDGHDVIVCDEPFAEAPHVHLPGASGDIVYAWLEGEDFVTPTGDRLASGLSALDLAEEHIRFAFSFYRVRLDGTSVLDYAPAVLVDEGVLLAPFVGAPAEGLISARVAAGEYALDPTLPIRVHVEGLSPAADDDALTPGLRKQLDVIVANLADGVVAADGTTCLAPLASHGDANPFFGAAAAELVGSLSPSMHTVGDDHFVFEYVVDSAFGGSVMGPTWFQRLAPLVVGGLVAPDPYQGTPHGNPTSIPGLELTLVKGGGTPCNAAH